MLQVPALEPIKGSTYRYLDEMLQIVWWSSVPRTDDEALYQMLRPGFPYDKAVYAQRQYKVPGVSQPQFVTLRYRKVNDELVLI